MGLLQAGWWAGLTCLARSVATATVGPAVKDRVCMIQDRHVSVQQCARHCAVRYVQAAAAAFVPHHHFSILLSAIETYARLCRKHIWLYGHHDDHHALLAGGARGWNYIHRSGDIYSRPFSCNSR